MWMVLFSFQVAAGIIFGISLVLYYTKPDADSFRLSQVFKEMWNIDLSTMKPKKKSKGLVKRVVKTISEEATSAISSSQWNAPQFDNYVLVSIATVTVKDDPMNGLTKLTFLGMLNKWYAVQAK